MRDAREELGLTQKEFADKGGLGLATVQRAEAGEGTPRTKTFAGLDKAANWPSRTARAIYHEGAPRPSSRPEPPPRPFVDPETGQPDREAILKRMIELVPSIRRHYGDQQADAMVGRIMDLAVQANAVGLVTSQLTESDCSGLLPASRTPIE